jgi:hypothetical protein
MVCIAEIQRTFKLAFYLAWHTFYIKYKAYIEHSICIRFN